MSKFKSGDFVVITRSFSYPQYIDTDATLVHESFSDLWRLKTWDNVEIQVSEQNFILAEEYYFKYPNKVAKDNTKKTSNNCKHENSYVNTISKSLKFIVCKDCKADLGDA